ncbi:MAG: HEPN domain-containing protein [Desulfomonilaceae bacterium]
MPQGRGTSSSSGDWLARAKGDLALALVPLPEGAFYEDLCFHAQQAAEKAIKAVYQWHNLAFRYTHDLGELLAGLREQGFTIPSEIEDAQILAVYASEYRYPSLAECVTIEEYQEATEHASKVVRWAQAIITGHPA